MAAFAPGREQPSFAFDPAVLREAVQTVVKKAGSQMGNTVKTALEYAKVLAPVGWDRENRLPAGAKTKAPRGYRGGTHRKNLTSVWNVETLEGDIHSEDGYGGYLHVGTSKMAARPDIVPGFMQAYRELESRLAGIV